MKLEVLTYSNTVNSCSDGPGRYDCREEWLSSGVSGVKFAHPEDKYAYEIEDGSEYVYVVYVLYRTGGTFSTTHGEIEVANVFSTSEKAFGLKSRIETKEVKSDEIHRGYIIWDGYFERIESVEVQVFKL